MDFNVIRNCIAEKMDIDPELITPESTPESLKIDSLDMVEIVMSLEEELGITLDGLEEIKTLSDLMDFIVAKG